MSGSYRWLWFRGFLHIFLNYSKVACVGASYALYIFWTFLGYYMSLIPLQSVA